MKSKFGRNVGRLSDSDRNIFAHTSMEIEVKINLASQEYSSNVTKQESDNDVAIDSEVLLIDDTDPLVF